MTGVRIIESLRGHTTGYAIPQFVIDAPEGGGKIPLNPNYLEGLSRLHLRNFEGKVSFMILDLLRSMRRNSQNY